jgi:2-dehydro-3-deoxygluconokinase
MPGDSFIRLWQREGVDTSTVRRTDRYQTGVYFVTHDAEGHHFLHYRANSAAAMYTPADLPDAAIAAARILYVSGISQGISTSACDAVFAAIALARRHGVKIAYDTNYRPRLWPPARAAAVMHAAMADADYAFPGLEDVQILTGLADPDAMLDFYLRLGCRVVALKMGAAGAYVATADSRVRLPAHRVTCVDATGAGDTFCGAFLARALAGDDPVQAARYAGVAAALKCTGYGAVGPIPTAAQVMAVLNQTQ